MKREAFLILFGLFTGCVLETEGLFSGDGSSSDDFRQDDGFDVDVEVDRIAADADSDADADFDLDTGFEADTFEADAEVEWEDVNTCESDCRGLPRVSTAHCEERICVIDSCISGWGDCNGDPDDGCEKDLTSVNNCGSCGNNCTVLDHVSHVRCEVDECVVVNCDLGFQNANGIASDGCEYFCTITSGAHEVCDAVDNDCDTEVDEDCGSLVLYLSFDEGVGTNVNDGSIYGNDGTLYGGATFTTDAISGRALSFDGLDDYVEVADSTSLDSITSGFTVMVWVKPRTYEYPDYVFWKNDDAPSIRVATDHIHWTFILNIGIGTGSTSSILPNTWTLLTMTYDGSVLNAYINANFENSVSGSFACGDVLRIGTDGVAGRYFNGIIDEVVVYNQPLSQAKIHHYYSSIAL